MKFKLILQNNVGDTIKTDERGTDDSEKLIEMIMEGITAWMEHEDESVEEGVCPECGAPLTMDVENVGFEDNPKEESRIKCEACGWEDL